MIEWVRIQDSEIIKNKNRIIFDSPHENIWTLFTFIPTSNSNIQFSFSVHPILRLFAARISDVSEMSWVLMPKAIAAFLSMYHHMEHPDCDNKNKYYLSKDIKIARKKRGVVYNVLISTIQSFRRISWMAVLLHLLIHSYSYQSIRLYRI